MARLAVDTDRAPMLANDSVGKAHSQASALPYGFCRKKWIENPGQMFGANAGSVVLYGQANVAAHDFGANAHLAVAPNGLHGVAGVAENVDKHLLKLMCVRRQSWQVPPQILAQP